MRAPAEGRLAPHEVSRLRAAAHRARARHPGPVGELLFRELRACAEFGYRFERTALLERVAAEVLRGS